MPTYEYECKSCSHNFEVFQSMSDDPLKDCPQCGREIRRLIFGGTGIIFKGSGFYVTDKGKGGKLLSPQKTQETNKTESAGDKKDSPQQQAAPQTAAQQSSAPSKQPVPESKASLKSQTA